MMLRSSLVVLLLTACGGKTVPVVVGDAGLSACPSSPNCVSSQSDPSDEEHYIAPLTLGEHPVEIGSMTEWMASRERCNVVDQGQRWVHATCTTALFRWTDDIGLFVDPEAGVVHVRSASRVGRSDLGANRKRVEAMRAEWDAGL